MKPTEVPAALAVLGAAAVRQATSECPGDCGLPEGECGGHTPGGIEGMVRIVLAAVLPELDRAGHVRKIADLAPPTVGAALQRTLLALGIKQAALARITGLTEKHISQIATGKAALSPDVANRFAGATGVPSAVWLGIDATRREWDARIEAASGRP